MNYVDSNLLPSETIAKRAKIHWFIYVPSAIVLLFSIGLVTDQSTRGFGSIPLLIGLFMLAKAYVTVISTELAVTSKRVIAKYGFISRQTIELNLPKVESLRVDQTLFGRMFNFGTVIVNGTGGIRAPFLFIDDPLSVRKSLNEQVERLESAQGKKD